MIITPRRAWRRRTTGRQGEAGGAFCAGLLGESPGATHVSTLDQQPPLSTPRVVDYLRVAEPAPVVLANGMGVDITALLVELESRGTPCTARIEAAGLPVPPKSSCFMLCLQMVSRLTATLYLWATKLSAV